MNCGGRRDDGKTDIRHDVSGVIKPHHDAGTRRDKRKAKSKKKRCTGLYCLPCQNDPPLCANPLEELNLNKEWGGDRAMRKGRAANQDARKRPPLTAVQAKCRTWEIFVFSFLIR